MFAYLLGASIYKIYVLIIPFNIRLREKFNNREYFVYNKYYRILLIPLLPSAFTTILSAHLPTYPVGLL